MKKLGVIIGISFFILFGVWWYMQAPVSGGVFPEKRAGLEIVEINEDDAMTSISFPVRWIKRLPFEQPPTINEIKLLDENNEVFAFMEGPLQLRTPYKYKWNERNTYGEIEVFLNGHQAFKDEYSSVIRPIENELPHEYKLSSAVITVNEKEYIYSFEEKYKYQYQFVQYGNNRTDGLQALFYYFTDSSLNSSPEGFVVNLTGLKGQTIEEIMFWLPGMGDNYFGKHVLYSYTNDLEKYYNTTEEFKGEKLQLPHTISEKSIVIYFPYTPEIAEALSDSLITIIPYFILNNGEERYYSGGMGSIGPFDRKLQYQDLFIKPNK